MLFNDIPEFIKPFSGVTLILKFLVIIFKKTSQTLIGMRG